MEQEFENVRAPKHPQRSSCLLRFETGYCDFKNEEFEDL